MLGFSTRDPAVAIALEDVSGAARSKSMEMMVMTARGPESMPSVRAAGKETLLREPLDVSAARSMGSVIVRENKDDLALEIFTLIGQQTLREQLVHLYLLGKTFELQKWDAFQREAETILKTRPAMRDQILGMFAQLVGQGLETQRFRARLAEQPEWRGQFFSILGQTVDDGDRIYALMKDQKARGAAPSVEEMRVWLLRELGRSDSNVYAMRWRELQNPALPRDEQRLRNPDFEGSVAPPPFDWTFYLGERTFAEITTSPDGEGDAMYVELKGREDATVAMQVLDLEPGAYDFSARIFTIVDEDNGELQFSISCARGSTSEIVAIGRPEGTLNEWGEWKWQFAIPPGCPLQKFAIGLDADFIAADIGAYFDDFSLQPRGRR